MRASYIILLIAFCIAAYVFTQYPELDLQISHIFYDPEKGFIYADATIALFSYHGIYVLTTIISLFLLAQLILGKLLGPKSWILSTKKTLFLTLALALAPGAAVHWGAKEIWDRSRPRNVIEFGGTEPYQPAFELGGTNAKSFVSGHTAMGMYTTSLAFVVTPKYRLITFISCFLFGCFVGAMRIIQGAHFLSDTLFATILTLTIIFALKDLIKPNKTND